MIEFKLPDIGEGIAEGEIVKWLVAEGAAVEEHQAVVEVMTDKATVEIPAPASGRILKLLPEEGDTVPVGSVLFHLEAAAAAAAPAATAPAAATAAAPRPSVPPAGEDTTTIEFKLPDVGEGIAEGEIVRWIVEEGASVEEHQAVVEVMTDKATVEVPAPAAGTITKILASAGEVVPVGQVIFHLATTSAVPAVPSAVAAGVAASSPGTTSGGATHAIPTSSGNGRSSSKVLAVPSARRVAREMGIDLGLVPGTGRNGVIRRADVEAFASSPAPTSTAPVRAAASGEIRVPFRGVRRKIADAMMRSVSTAAHFTVVEELDVTQLVDLRAKAKVIGAESGIKVTYMPFIMKAVALGLAKYPSLNGHLDEQAQEIVNPATVNLGIATDTPNGLIVPVIQAVESKDIFPLAAELSDLASRTREGKIKPEELRGSTFTITNAGNIGGTLATPIINFPDIAILGVHRIAKRPGVVETPGGDRIEVRRYMNLSCSVDHRLADGADAARFLAYLRTLLEEPGLLALGLPTR